MKQRIIVTTILQSKSLEDCNLIVHDDNLQRKLVFWGSDSDERTNELAEVPVIAQRDYSWHPNVP
jgi:hypothetical protein